MTYDQFMKDGRFDRWLSCKFDGNGADPFPLKTIQSKLYDTLSKNNDYKSQEEDFKKPVDTSLSTYVTKIAEMNEQLKTDHELMHSESQLANLVQLSPQHTHSWNREVMIEIDPQDLSVKAKELQTVCDETKAAWKSLSEKIQEFISADSELVNNIQIDYGLAIRIDWLCHDLLTLMTQLFRSLIYVPRRLSDARHTFATFLISDVRVVQKTPWRSFKKVVNKVLEGAKKHWPFGRGDPHQTQHHGNSQ